MQLRIDTGSGQPIYRQLVEQIREAAARGKLRAGEKLPSVRTLSRTLVINPNTVARAFTELEREGVIHTRPGTGAFVAEPKAELTKTARRQRLQAQVDRLLTEAIYLGLTAQEVQSIIAGRMGQFRWSDSSAESS